MKYAIIRTQQPNDIHCRHWLPRGTLVERTGFPDAYGNVLVRSVFDVEALWGALPKGKIEQRVSPYDVMRLPAFVGRALSVVLRYAPSRHITACRALLSLALR
ncbi:hypothetical protein R6138_04578 [Ralstonia thomasii]|nr:hypothetical protein R6138_04578 [Ralstonia sp. LMG 18095]